MSNIYYYVYGQFVCSRDCLTKKVDEQRHNRRFTSSSKKSGGNKKG